MRAENPSSEQKEAEEEMKKRVENLESELKTCKEANDQKDAEMSKTKDELV